METEDLIRPAASSNSDHGNEHNDKCESCMDSDFLPLTSEAVEEINEEASGAMSDDLHENIDTLTTTDLEKNGDTKIPASQCDLEMTTSVSEIEKLDVSFVHAENGFLSAQSEVSLSNPKKNEELSSKRRVDASSLSDAKRPRVTVDEKQPSVHVTYSSLPRESKQKLEKLLEQWSQWHSKRCSSNDSNVVLECGEKTYFPALRVGLDNPSAVTFWVDNQTKIQSSKEFVPLDSTSIPLYDRGYSLALTSPDGSSGLDGGVEKLNTSRCFNCASYSHALKDCPKPRDSVAVNNARKEHKSKRNQHANARNSTRYYQSSRGGKYDGLTPGVLDAETRRALGLGELDPPPWLNRMREIGYPPGYLDANMEDQPSGITIFGDESYKNENEEGEILDVGQTVPSRKMTVEFPGINAPIPENAEERLWAPPSSSSSSQSRYSSHRRHNNHHSSENSGRGHHSEQRSSGEQRWSSDQRWSSEQRRSSEQRWSRNLEDDGPPGCDPGTSPSLANHFPRYGDAESRGSPSTPWSSSYGRSWSDRGRRSPLVNEGSPKYGHYGSFPYSSSPRPFHGSGHLAGSTGYCWFGPAAAGKLAGL